MYLFAETLNCLRSAPQPSSSVRSDSCQQWLCGQTGRQGGSEGEGHGRRWAVDPGWGGQLQPLHQQVSVWKYFKCQDSKWRKHPWLSFSSASRYEVDDIDEEGKEWVPFMGVMFQICDIIMNIRKSFIYNVSHSPSLYFSVFSLCRCPLPSFLTAFKCFCQSHVVTVFNIYYFQ